MKKMRWLALLLAVAVLATAGSALGEAPLEVAPADVSAEEGVVDLPEDLEVPDAPDAGTTPEESNAVKPTGVSITKGKKATLYVGDRLTLKAKLKPSNAKTKLTWKSSNRKVARVDSAGKVTALKKGKATITVRTANGKKATCVVTVKATVELFNYLGQDMYKVAKKFKGLKFTQGREYTDSPCSYYTGKYFSMIEGGPDDPMIAGLSLFKASKYTLCGVRVGMKLGTAQKKLEAFANKRGRLDSQDSSSWDGTTYYNYAVWDMKYSGGSGDLFVSMTARKGVVTGISLAFGG